MKQTLITILAILLCAAPLFAQETLIPDEEQTMAVGEDTIVAEAVADSLQTDTLLVLPYPQILLDMPNAHIEQDSLVTLLMEEKIAGIERGEQEKEGWRVQVYSSNHPKHGKANALLIEQRVKELVNEKVYVIYTSPSWKVRLGDFRTIEEAQTFRDVFKELCPDLADYTYIVKDKIKIHVAH